jgi:hypothetical protein
MQITMCKDVGSALTCFAFNLVDVLCSMVVVVASHLLYEKI